MAPLGASRCRAGGHRFDDTCRGVLGPHAAGDDEARGFPSAGLPTATTAKLRTNAPLEMRLTLNGRLIAYMGTAVPLQEGKTASGQVEMLQLYHRISVVPDGFRRQERPSDFRCASTWLGTSKPVARLSHISQHISKSPAGGRANSGSAAGISLLMALAPVSVESAGSLDLSRRSAYSRQHRASCRKSPC